MFLKSNNFFLHTSGKFKLCEVRIIGTLQFYRINYKNCSKSRAYTANTGPPFENV